RGPESPWRGHGIGFFDALLRLEFRGSGAGGEGGRTTQSNHWTAMPLQPEIGAQLFISSRTVQYWVASQGRCESTDAAPSLECRLGDGADRFGAGGLGGRRVGAKPVGWLEQRAAQVLQQAQTLRVHGEAAPAAGSPA